MDTQTDTQIGIKQDVDTDSYKDLEREMTT